MNKHVPNIYRGNLPNPGSSASVPDGADLTNLAGALFFGAVWWIPQEWEDILWFFDGSIPVVCANAVTLFLIVCVIGSVWFFLVHMLCGMAGGGRTAVWIARIATGIAATAFLFRIAMFLWSFAC